MLEHLSRLRVGEVAVIFSRPAVGLDDTLDELPKTLLASRSAKRASEILGRHNRGGIDTPEVREFNALLLEDDLACLPIGLHHIAALPGHLVIWMHARGEDALDAQPRGLRL